MKFLMKRQASQKFWVCRCYFIDDKLHAISPKIKDKDEISPDAWNRLRQLLKSPEIQDQPKIQKEREALKSSYEKIARWSCLSNRKVAISFFFTLAKVFQTCL